MILKPITASFTLFLFVLLNSCSGETKSIVNPSLLVDIKADSSVWYNIIEYAEDTVKQKIKEPSKENLKKIIADYKERCQKENVRDTYLVRGHNSLTFPFMKEILSAFKENKVYNYELTAYNEHGELTLRDALKDNNMTLYMPKSEEPDIKATDTLTLLLLKNNVLAYNGSNIVETESYDYKTIRQFLMNESKKFGDNLFVAIKLPDETYYEHYGNILVEMLACKIKKYSKVNLLPVDIELIKKFNSAT